MTRKWLGWLVVVALALAALVPLSSAFGQAANPSRGGSSSAPAYWADAGFNNLQIGNQLETTGPRAQTFNFGTGDGGFSALSVGDNTNRNAIMMTPLGAITATASITTTSGNFFGAQYYGNSGAAGRLIGQFTDGAAAIGVKLGNASSLANATAKIAVFYSDNESTEKMAVYSDGALSSASTKLRGTITLSAGTGTATVLSGAICVCTDTTANASVKCAVATTTLTATGTTTDVIAYICIL